MEPEDFISYVFPDVAGAAGPDDYGDGPQRFFFFFFSYCTGERGHCGLACNQQSIVVTTKVSFHSNPKESENESEVAQLCPTLCDPVDCSPPGSSAHGILQARILEWVAISFSRGSSQLKD